jgi:ELWxxDGT repeat protein
MASRPLGFTLAAVLVLLPAALPAAPHLVKDLNTLPYVGGLLDDSEPRGFDAAVSFFTVNDAMQGTELWRTDGTPGGTERVTDVCAGTCGSRPNTITVHAGRAYFVADDGFSGAEMWVSDGTPGSERRLRDLCPGPCDSSPSPVEEVGGRLVFLSTLYSGETFRAALWETDGTAEGTVAVQDFCSGCYLLSSLIPLEAPARKALFYLSTPSGLELWVTDGTAAGTHRFETSGDFPLQRDSLVVPGDGFAWFWASDGLWRTDGTAAGTFRLKPIEELATPSPGDHALNRWTVWHGLLIGALAQGEILRSDGTPAGTFRITKVPDEAFLSQMMTTDGEVFFTVADNQAVAHNVLWSSRGTVETTGPKLDLGPVADVRFLISLGDRLVFLRGEPGTFYPSQLWVTDGTAAGTRRLPPPPGFTLGRDLFPAGDHAFFFRSEPGIELWVTDGTDAGTHPVRDFRTGPGSSGPIDQAALGGKLVFSAATTYFSRAPLFVSDGTAAGTQLLSTNADRAFSFFRFGNRLLFSSTSVRGYPPRTWSTDGTPAGTFQLAGFTGFADPAVLGGQVLFSGLNDGLGMELWATDGVTRPATLVKDIDPFIVAAPHHLCEAESSRPDLGAVVGGRLLFAADDGRSGRELWASDGTAAGTVQVRDLNPGRSPGAPSRCEDLPHSPGRRSLGLSSNPQSFVLLGMFPDNRALFTADDGPHGRELWITNGTFRGTRLVADLLPGPQGSEPHDLVRFGNNVYFLAANDGMGESLWRTDGTAAGTVRVHDLILDGHPSWGRNLTVAGSRLYFTVYNETTGAELWASTGSTSGTGLVVDLNPGPGSSSPQSLTAIGNVLLFAADDGLTGLEPWRTDGTAAGTLPIGDLNPGRDASSPGPFTEIQNLVMTGADDGVHGREPWAIPKADILSTSEDLPPGEGRDLGSNRNNARLSFAEALPSPGDGRAGDGRGVGGEGLRRTP